MLFWMSRLNRANALVFCTCRSPKVLKSAVVMHWSAFLCLGKWCPQMRCTDAHTVSGVKHPIYAVHFCTTSRLHICCCSLNRNVPAHAFPHFYSSAGTAPLYECYVGVLELIDQIIIVLFTFFLATDQVTHCLMPRKDHTLSC